MPSDSILPAAATPLPVPAAQPRRRRNQSRREGARFHWLALAIVLTMTVFVVAGGPDSRAVLGPVVAIVAVTFLYLVVLTKREGKLPVFEAASFFVIATAVYTIVPLVQFAMSGMQSMSTGDYRIYAWQPTPEEFGGFAWRHVMLLTTFVIVYLTVRGKHLWRVQSVQTPSRAMLFVIVGLVISLRVYFLVLDLYLGPTVSLYEGGTEISYQRLPLFLQQITNVLMIMLLTLKQCLVVVLLTHWKRGYFWRAILILWLGFELLMTVVAMESRTGAMVLVLTFIVVYHHLIKPIRIHLAFLGGGFLLFAFLVFGLFRDVGAQGMTDRRAVWGAPTEFLILYGNAYDIHMRQLEGSLVAPPPFLGLSDFYLLIPSQILPFYKWEPSLWYKNEVMEARHSGMGFMYGIVAQSVVGYDWPELFIRSVLLALFYALVYRMWRRYSGSFWATITHLFILTWAYYAFRFTSFEIFYRLMYYLAPTAVVVKLLTMLASGPIRIRGRRRAVTA
jgi:hypothetical protein